MQPQRWSHKPRLPTAALAESPPHCPYPPGRAGGSPGLPQVGLNIALQNSRAPCACLALCPLLGFGTEMLRAGSLCQPRGGAAPGRVLPCRAPCTSGGSEAHARSPLGFCTHADRVQLQQELLAASTLQRQQVPSTGSSPTQKSILGATDTEPSGEGKFHAMCSGNGDTPAIWECYCSLPASVPFLCSWLQPMSLPQPSSTLTCSWPGRRWRSGGSCLSAWPPGATLWRWHPNRRCPHHPWP